MRYLDQILDNQVLDNQIRNRESWFKIICWAVIYFVLVFILFIILYNIILGNIKLNLVDFKFSDLLSIIMAFFALYLSIIFYMKSNETSSIFQLNSYQFSLKFSEMLLTTQSLVSQIQAIMNERFKNLDDNYGYIREKMDDFTHSSIEITTEQINTKNKELQIHNDEKQILQNKLERESELDDAEKIKIFERLCKNAEDIKNIEVDKAKLEEFQKFSKSEIIERMRKYLQSSNFYKIFKTHQTSRSDENEIISLFNYYYTKFPKEFIKDLKEIGYLGENDQLSTDGLQFIKKIFDS